MIRICSEVREMAYDDEVEGKDLITKTEAEVYKLNSFSNKQDIVPISIAVKEAVENIEKWGNKELVGVRTGFLALDSLLGGFQNTDLIILAGRTSMGKTLSAVDFIITAAEWGTPVAFFSLEMARMAITTRMICAETGFGFNDIR